MLADTGLSPTISAALEPVIPYPFMPVSGWGATTERGTGMPCKTCGQKIDEDRFWPRVFKVDGCWEWGGAVSGDYGSFRSKGVSVKAHRFSYELAKGKIPPGLVIDHLCRNTLCVKPEHLEAVSYRTNMVRGVAPQAVAYRAGTCIKGHPMKLLPCGRRFCNECGRVRARRRYWSKKNAG